MVGWGFYYLFFRNKYALKHINERITLKGYVLLKHENLSLGKIIYYRGNRFSVL